MLLYLQLIYHAKVAQLVERQPSKLNVAGSNPVFRSKTLLEIIESFFLRIILLIYVQKSTVKE